MWNQFRRHRSRNPHGGFTVPVGFAQDRDTRLRSFVNERRNKYVDFPGTLPPLSKFGFKPRAQIVLEFHCLYGVITQPHPNILKF